MLKIKKDESLKDTCCDVAEQAGRQIRAYADEVSHEARDLTAATMQHVRAKPMQSTLIAAGIGFVLGALFRR